MFGALVACHVNKIVLVRHIVVYRLAHGLRFNDNMAK